MKKSIAKANNIVKAKVAGAVPSLRTELLENRQAIIDGSKSILEYSDTCIRISSGRLIIKFSGTDLYMRSMNGSSSIIEGKITLIEFL